MRCTRGKCAFIDKNYNCKILQEQTDENCSFFKTEAQLKAERKAVKERLKKIGFEEKK